MSDKIPARFRKTKTEKWAVMAPVEDLEKAMAEGGKIEVQRKSGDWSTFTVGSLGRPFDVDGVSMCYGYAPGDEDPGAGAAGAPAGAAASASASASAPADGRPPAGRSAGGRPGGPAGAPPGARGGRNGGGPARSRAQAAPPPPDSSEPLPVYQGGPEDEWGDGF